MHQSSGRWQLGLILSLITALLWGMLPLALKGVLQNMDAVTITWYRFMAAVVLMFIFLAPKKKLPDLKWLKSKRKIVLFILVSAGLGGNYFFYIMGLDFITPSAAQVVIQIAPLMLLIGGLFIFNEKFNRYQWLGLVTFLFGLVLFFNQRYQDIFSTQSEYTWGLLLILIAAVTWAAYALAQKQLLMSYNSQQIMFVVYLAGAVFFLPVADIGSVTQLTSLQWGLLIFCCLNTLVAYGCFAEALAHWEASRVSAVLAITPLITIGFGLLVYYFYPSYLEVEELNWISILGGVVLVVGASLTALAKSKKLLLAEGA
jgi:drug/metabolite transporter (DMT)-like permease